MKRQVRINNNSVETAGITNDYKQAICEYIWNGFDAQASKVSINYSSDEIGNITFLSITDNGTGIDFNDLDNTFGAFLDSVKKQNSYQRSSNVKGKKGKGRYSFKCFAHKVIWQTVFKHEDKLIKYDISISNEDKAHFEESENKQLVKNEPIGTTVIFENIFGLFNDYFVSDEFKNYIAKQFAWFLFLNKSKGYIIEINGVTFDYEYLIADTEPYDITISDKENDVDYTFEVTYIRWTEKINENYYLYLLDELKFEKTKIPSSLNYKDNGFHHSVYISSSFFSDFVYEEVTNRQDSTPVFGKTQKSPVFKTLYKQIKLLLEEREKFFIRELAAEKLIAKYISSGVIREFKSTSYDMIRKRDLIDTIKEIYCIQPKIFKDLKKEQEKTIVGFLDLLLDSGEREKVLTILEGIVNMTEQERTALANILQVTELSKITHLLKLIEDRYRIYYALKEAVYNKELKANERDDVQKIVESSFWIFGEQYSIVTAAEPKFEEALKRFNYILKGVTEKKHIEHPDKYKEMDVFALRQNPLVSTIENIVVELKHPLVKLGEKELSQVKKYLNVVLSVDEFNASNMSWSFYLIGNDFDSSQYIQNELESNSQHGESYLVFKKSSKPTYKIYVKKWSEVFNDFELRYKFLNDKLKLKRELLLANVKLKEELHQIVELTVV